jgi:small subunit ribosomal protein S13
MIKMEKNQIKYIVRVVNTDLNGNKGIGIALTKIKGIGKTFSNAICAIAGIDPLIKAGLLSDEQLNKLGLIMKSPVEYGFPSWMLNRRNDYESGEDKHLITADLSFTKDNDIKRLRKIKSYKGVRHSSNLPVRGQRTKSNFRRNKGKVQGVSKKKGKSGRV